MKTILYIVLLILIFDLLRKVCLQGKLLFRRWFCIILRNCYFFFHFLFFFFLLYFLVSEIYFLRSIYFYFSKSNFKIIKISLACWLENNSNFTLNNYKVLLKSFFLFFLVYWELAYHLHLLLLDFLLQMQNTIEAFH